MVRVRPLNTREINEGATPCLFKNDDNPQEILINSKPEPKSFIFDYIGGENTTQEDLFRVVGKPLTEACLDGILFFYKYRIILIIIKVQ